MLSAHVAAVMIHVPRAQTAQALAWYKAAFPTASAARSPEGDFEFLRLGSLQLEVVPADEKVASGPAGVVVYWEVEDFARSLAGLRQIGATLYRGPMRIEGHRIMCQLRDPWGNCLGLRGPAA